MKILLICFVLLVLLSGCEKKEFLFASMYNASDDTLSVLITNQQLRGATIQDYIFLVYPQYGFIEPPVEHEEICGESYFSVRLWNRPVITTGDAKKFFRQLASTEKDTSFHYTVSGTFTSAKND